MTGVKLVLIGAGSSTFALPLVRDLCSTAGLSGSVAVLVDPDTTRVAVVRRVAERMASELRSDIRFEVAASREEALANADFVVNTAQVGGHSWTEQQRSLAESHGYYRGIRLHDYGQALFFLDVARDMERLCPGAWLLQVANPVFEGCTLIHRETKVNVVGLCHGFLSYRKIARVLGLDENRVTAEAPGFNHCIWMTDFRLDGTDVYPLLDEWIARDAEKYWTHQDTSYDDNDMSRAAIHQYKMFGRMPVGDTVRFTGWWYHTDLDTKQEWFGRTGGFDSALGWATYLDQLAKRVDRLETAMRDETQSATDLAASVGSEPIINVVDALVNDQELVMQANIPNRGLLPDFPADLVVECRAVVSGSGVRGVVPRPLPPRVVTGALTPRWHSAELAVRALQARDKELLLLAVLANHQTRSLEQAEGLLTQWLAEPANQAVRDHFRHC
jgi:alpha-galactosidase